MLNKRIFDIILIWCKFKYALLKIEYISQIINRIKIEKKFKCNYILFNKQLWLIYH